MEDASTGSIHDIDSAPEAPLHYSLSSLELSPQSNVGSPRTRRQSASFYLAQSSALAVPPLLDDHVTRERSDTAPGRMDNIEETDSTQFENVTSSGNHHLLRRRTRSSGSQEFSDGDDPAASFGEQSKDAQAFEPEQGFETMYWCGIPLPWCKLGCETKVSSCLVRHAPCFWGCGEKLTVGATDRSILYRLNLLSAFFAFFVIIAASFLWFVLEAEFVVDRYPDLVGLKEESDGLFLNLWNLNGNVFALGFLSVIIFFTCLCTLKVVTEVNLRAAVRYLWVLVWVMPVLIFFVISLVDYVRVSNVWIRHWWRAPSMAWFRNLFCANNTANTLCMVPIEGGFSYKTEGEWCTFYFDSTNCTEIRDDAQVAMGYWVVMFHSSCVAWGALMAILIYLTICMLEGIITKPIVQASRESNAPAWMLVPIIGCLSLGAIFLFSISTEFGGGTQAHVWVGALYVIAGGGFFVSAILGWFTSNYSILDATDKRNKRWFVICHIVVNILTGALMIAIFARSVYASISVNEDGLTDTERGRAACSIDTAGSCTWCNNRIGLPECPEYTEEEVTKVIQVQYKASAALALIFILYSTTSLRFGCVLKRNIEMYQIDFV